MPRKSTIRKARQDAREGKAPTTQAGEFVREEVEHIRQGKHGARSTKQAIAIGLSKARRAGVPLRPPKPGRTSERTRKQAERAYAKGQSGQRKKPAAKRSRATLGALKREPRTAASRQALAKQARTTAAERRKRGTVTRTIKAAARRKRATPRALRSHRRVTSSRKAATRRKAA